jgi:3-methylcrotonyl-CoA carboxylase alpha subunit
VRLYARTRRRSCPQTGRVERLRLPAGSASTRASRRATRSARRYDPLIAKLIAHGATRDDALDRLAAALDETEVGGVVTNLPFLRWLVAHPRCAPARRRPRS